MNDSARTFAHKAGRHPRLQRARLSSGRASPAPYFAMSRRSWARDHPSIFVIPIPRRRRSASIERISAYLPLRGCAAGRGRSPPSLPAGPAAVGRRPPTHRATALVRDHATYGERAKRVEPV